MNKEMIDLLKRQGVDSSLLERVASFSESYDVPEDARDRVHRPQFTYYGRKIWEQALTGILAGENLLLVGSKATGKNVLADSLAWIFQRPSWNISFHVNTDSTSLIGTDTFVNNEVRLRKGPIAECAEAGGFGILDEINMARNDAVAVLHATLDYRRIIDVPGYERIFLRPETRFIATMNYGYIGTRELNEALTSRFLVIHVPALEVDQLNQLLRDEFPTASEEWLDTFSRLFRDLHEKTDNGEISTKPVDLRGLLASLRLIREGLDISDAIDMGMVNKSFDAFERQLVRDVVKLRIPPSVKPSDVFPVR